MATTYTFTLRAGVTLVDAKVTVNGSDFLVDEALTAGGGSIVTTDQNLAVALAGMRMNTGLVFDVTPPIATGGGTVPNPLLAITARPGDFTGGQLPAYDPATGTFIPAAGAVAVAQPRTVTTVTTIVATDTVVNYNLSASLNQVLPSAVGWTSRFTVSVVSNGNFYLLLTTVLSQTIDGASSLTLGPLAAGGSYQSVDLVATGGNWRIV